MANGYGDRGTGEDGPAPVTEGAVELARGFHSRYGVPLVRWVDRTIFTKRYYTHCLTCAFCADACCSYGVDVDLYHVDRLTERAEAIEAYTGIPRGRWFSATVIEDDEMPGGGSRRTQVEDGACVFLDRENRGCRIHRFCEDLGLDYHDLKSMVDCLFPLTVCDATLAPADEVDDRTLVCVDRGPTLYEGLRDEVRYYFGSALVSVLDDMSGP